MDRRRGLQSVFAMARPARSNLEREAVAAAFAAMPDVLSRAAKAKLLAGRVAAQLLDLADEGEGITAKIAVLQAFNGDPVATLAASAEIDLHAQLMALRVEQFTARGGTWCDRAAWEREQSAVRSALIERLAGRFRRK